MVIMQYVLVALGLNIIANESKKIIGCKDIIANIHRIEAYDSIMCGYFFIRFIGFMLKVICLLVYIKLFSLNDYENSDKTLLKYFQ